MITSKTNTNAAILTTKVQPLGIVVGESPRIQIVVKPTMQDKLIEGDTDGAASDSEKEENGVEFNKSSSLWFRNEKINCKVPSLKPL
jgi:hypothetical protein